MEGNIVLYHDFLRGHVTGDDTIVLSSESTGGQGGGGGQHQGGGSGLAGKLLVQQSHRNFLLFLFQVAVSGALKAELGDCAFWCCKGIPKSPRLY